MASSSTSNSHIDNATGDATKEQHVAWLASIGVSTSGTKDDVIKRVNTFKKYPRLVEKLKKRPAGHTSFRQLYNQLISHPKLHDGPQILVNYLK